MNRVFVDTGGFYASRVKGRPGALRLMYTVHASSSSWMTRDAGSDNILRRTQNVTTPAVVEMIRMTAFALTGISPPGGSLRL